MLVSKATYFPRISFAREALGSWQKLGNGNGEICTETLVVIYWFNRKTLFPRFFFSNWYSGGWSPIGSTRHCGHQQAYCASPGWLWWWRNWWNHDWQGKPNYSEETCPSAALSITNPTCCPDANPGRRGGKPATNRLSYGTAFISRLTRMTKTYRQLYKEVHVCSNQNYPY
jgi:hypothetical protein